MAVSKEQKLLYSEKVRPYKNAAEDLKKEVSTIKAVARKNPKLEPYYLVKACIVGVQRAHTLVMMSRLSQEIQSIKNDTLLNDARKEISSHISDLLKIVGDHLDGSLTENQEKLEKIQELTPAQKLNLLSGFKDCIESIRAAMGETSKWRWYFPDMYLKLITLARNLFDFKLFDRTKDPRDDNYRPLQEYMRFLLEESQYAAQEYRSKYELSTHEVAELQIIQRIFEMQKKVVTYTGQKDEVAKVSIAIDNIKEKIEAQIAEKKGEKKKKG